MEPTFKTSFIPKKPIEPSLDSKVEYKSGINFFMLIAMILFITSVILSAGVFAYKFTLSSAIEIQLRTLEKVRQSFDPAFVTEANRLNTRIDNVNKILNSHLAPSSIFSLLEDFTLQTVSFKRFLFKDGEDGTIKIESSGEADSFRSIVLQSDNFGQSGYMRDVLFAGLEPNDRQNINFTMEASLDPQLVLYRKNLVPVSVPDVEPVTQDPAQDIGIFGETQQ